MRVGRVISCLGLLGAACLAAGPAVASPAEATEAYPPLGLAESSGMAASGLYDGVVWIVEDSGEPPEELPVVRAFAQSGAEVGSVTLEGWNNRDTEALSIGPGRMLWVADIGDNRMVRETVVVHTFAEPTELAAIRLHPVSYRLRYPDGSRDAEALMVDPVDGRVYVASKSAFGDGSMYVAPEELRSGATHDLTRIMSVPSWITDGSFTPDGEQLVLLRATAGIGVEGLIYAVSRPGGGAPAEFTETGVLDLPRGAQPEMLTVTSDGNAVLVGSEGEDEPVWSVPLAASPAPTTPAPDSSEGAAEAVEDPTENSGACHLSDPTACLDEPIGWLVAGLVGIAALLITAQAVLRRSSD